MSGMVRCGAASGRSRVLVACLLACVAATGAKADTQLFAGQQLVLNDTFSEDVTISTDAALRGQIRLSMDGSLSCLSVVSGATLVVTTANCSEDQGHLRIEVSPDTSVTATSTRDGNLQVGDLHAPLIVTLMGSGDLHAGRSGGLVLAIRGSGDATSDQVDGPATIDVSGSGDVRLRRVYGPLASQLHGSGDLVVGTIQSDNVAMDASGSGDTVIGAGRIANLAAHIAGSADLGIAATIGNAEVSATGGGDIRLGQVTGHLTKSASGGSDIVVGGSGLVQTIIAQSARKIADSGESEGREQSSSGFHDVLAALGVILACYIGWRIFRRRREAGTAQRAAPSGPVSPAVQALAATMSRLDHRLSQLESYVTTREFDLARKFRELEK